MAEFVSAIVGLAAVGAKAGNSLYALIDTLKDAPNQFLALSNEVTDFREALARLIEAGELGELALEENGRHGSLNGVLSRGRETLREVEELVQKVVKQQHGETEGTRVNRIQWLRRVRKAKKLQESLRVRKLSLCNFITFCMLKSSAKVGVQVTGIRMTMESLGETQRALIKKQDTMSSHFAVTQNMLEQAVGTPLESAIGMGSTPTKSKRIATGLHLSNVPVPTARGKVSLTRLYSEDSEVRSPRFRASFKVLKAVPLRCLDECPCRCHYRSVIRSPRYLSDYLGDLFLGCSDLPWCFSGFVQCNEQTCRRSRSSAAELRYFLPPWFSYAVASFSASFTLRMFPLNISLQARRIIPYDSPILICVQEGDAEGIRRLLRSGMASINDVDPYGLGVLYYSAYYCWRGSGHETAMETCRFLLDLGAHADWEDEIGNTPMETMVDDTLVALAMEKGCSHGHDPANFQHIAQLFGKSSYDLLEDYADDRRFTTLHEVLLGIQCGCGTLSEYLASFGQATLPTQFIDAPDACGRTALTWAVEYGWADAVRTLLKYGSNPHQLRPSIHGKSPLLHLVISGPASQNSDAGFLDVVRALLQAGVDVNAVDHEGWTPLHVAASWNNYDVIKDLAAFGTGALDWDALTDDKKSAIELALGAGFDAEVQQLLQTHVWSEDNSIDAEDDHQSSSGTCSSYDEDDEDVPGRMDDEIDRLDKHFYDALEIV